MNFEVEFDYETSCFVVEVDADVLYTPATFDNPREFDWSYTIEEITEYDANDKVLYRDLDYLNSKMMGLIDELVEVEVLNQID